MAELQDISPDHLKDIVQQHEKWVKSVGRGGKRVDHTKATIQKATCVGTSIRPN